MTKRELCAPVWSEGMFLLPQHLQYFSRHLDSQRWRSVRHLSPFSWGFTRLHIQLEALGEGIFAVKECDVLFPGGLVASCPDSMELPSRSFAGLLPPEDDGLEVFLGVPDFKLGQTNLLRAENSGDTLANPRYMMANSEVPDAYNGENPRKIEVSRLRGKVFFGDEDRSGFLSIPLARLKTAPGGAGGMLDEDFIPPMLTLDGWDGLTGLSQEIASRIVTTFNSLRKSYAGREVVEVIGQPRGQEAILKLMTVGGSAQAVNHLAQVGSTAPFDFYLEVSRLCGALMIFVGSEEVQLPPPYRHDAPGPCFKALKRTLWTILERLASPAYIRRSFTRHGDRLEVDLEQDWVAGNRQLYVCASGGPDQETIANRVAGIKLCAPRDIETVVQRRLGALPVNWLRLPPGSLPSRADAAYGIVSQTGNLWKGVQEDRVLSLTGAENIPYKFELFVV